MLCARSMMLPLLVLAASCREQDGYHCDRSVEVPIVAEGPNRLKLNVALGDVLSIDLPADIQIRGEPALGNRAIFDVKVVSDPLRLLVWPKIPQAAGAIGADGLLGERSNLQIFLDSGITILIELRIAEPDVAVQQVRLQFPDREKESAFVREKVAEESRRLQVEFEERRAALDRDIASAARERISRGLLVHGECESLREREMHDLVVLRAERICRIGGDLFVSFSIQNRSRTSFALDRIEVRPAGSDSAVISAQTIFEGQSFLAFDQIVRGVLAWPIDEETETTAEWTLVAFERAGAQRVVELEGVGF